MKGREAGGHKKTLVREETGEVWSRVRSFTTGARDIVMIWSQRVTPPPLVTKKKKKRRVTGTLRRQNTSQTC